MKKVDLERELKEAREVIEREKLVNTFLQSRLRVAEERAYGVLRGLHAFVAKEEEGAPLCIYGEGDNGLGVELFVLYRNIVGVRVTRGVETVTGAGLVNFEGES